jgi:regulatory protein YycH of two-component signal transduction system YycFG
MARPHLHDRIVMAALLDRLATAAEQQEFEETKKLPRDWSKWKHKSDYEELDDTSLPTNRRERLEERREQHIEQVVEEIRELAVTVEEEVESYGASSLKDEADNDDYESALSELKDVYSGHAPTLTKLENSRDLVVDWLREQHTTLD